MNIEGFHDGVMIEGDRVPLILLMMAHLKTDSEEAMASQSKFESGQFKDMVEHSTKQMIDRATENFEMTFGEPDESLKTAYTIFMAKAFFNGLDGLALALAGFTGEKDGEIDMAEVKLIHFAMVYSMIKNMAAFFDGVAEKIMEGVDNEIETQIPDDFMKLMKDNGAEGIIDATRKGIRFLLDEGANTAEEAARKKSEKITIKGLD